MKKVVLHLISALCLLIVSVGIGALIGYSSSMAVLVLGLDEYGEYIMFGVFIVSTIAIFASNFVWLEHFAEKKFEVIPEKTRDYFKDGDFSRKS
ncbi:MAG: hypothetical protein IKR92_05550 [Alphaproteobacteria bacterium]|nr:hypothetical protein [Alphaproteobacteria bacterium]